MPVDAHGRRMGAAGGRVVCGAVTAWGEHAQVARGAVRAGK